MKTLYHGGQKSGKSHLAEQKALELSGDTQPYYIATSTNIFITNLIIISFYSGAEVATSRAKDAKATSLKI